jgi:hypothetical protein
VHHSHKIYQGIKRSIMTTIFKIFMIPAAACLFSAAIAQQTIKGNTAGKKGITNFTMVANAEKADPERIIIKRKLPPAELLERKDKEKIRIQNKINELVPPFNGKLTTIAQSSDDELQQRTLEFPCNNFRALDDDNTSSPPDVNGAVGFDHLMTTLNTEVRIQNKQGAVINTTSLTGFWNGLGGHTDIFDPKITYDPYDRRWIFVCCASRRAANSALLIAVSQTPDPTGGWTLYTIDADPADLFWFDYPSLGFNRNWITVGGYMFNRPGMNNTQRSRVWVINKADVYAGGPNINVPFFDRTDYFHIAPAITYSATENTIWCVSNHNSNSNNSGFLRLFSITGSGAAPSFNLLNTINIGPSWGPPAVDAPQLTSAAGINVGDDRMLQTVFRNGVLWTGNNVFLPTANPTACAAQIVAINPVTQASVENIRTAADANNMTAYPSVAVNANNDLFFGYTSFSSAAYARATISYRRAGQGFFFYHYKNGEDWYVKFDNDVRNRWGDYSATFIDPEDDITAWTIQEYARPRVGITSYWGTWWGKVCPGSCSNDFLLSAGNNNVMRKYEANNTITSSGLIQNNSFIKYDAGVRVRLLPGFKAALGTRFQAYIEGCGGIR